MKLCSFSAGPWILGTQATILLKVMEAGGEFTEGVTRRESYSVNQKLNVLTPYIRWCILLFLTENQTTLFVQSGSWMHY